MRRSPAHLTTAKAIMVEARHNSGSVGACSEGERDSAGAACGGGGGGGGGGSGLGRLPMAGRYSSGWKATSAVAWGQQRGRGERRQRWCRGSSGAALTVAALPQIALPPAQRPGASRPHQVVVGLTEPWGMRARGGGAAVSLQRSTQVALLCQGDAANFRGHSTPVSPGNIAHLM